MPMLSHVKSGMHLSDKLLVGENKDFPFSELCTHVKQAYKYTLQVAGKYFIIEYKNQKLWRNIVEEVVQETA